MDLTSRNTFIVDNIMETVYDDIEVGAKIDIKLYIDILEHKHIVLEHLSSVFSNYAVNRTHEFKDPNKAGQKAIICARICKDLIQSGTREQKKDC